MTFSIIILIIVNILLLLSSREKWLFVLQSIHTRVPLMLPACKRWFSTKGLLLKLLWLFFVDRCTLTVEKLNIRRGESIMSLFGKTWRMIMLDYVNMPLMGWKMVHWKEHILMIQPTKIVVINARGSQHRVCMSHPNDMDFFFFVEIFIIIRELQDFGVRVRVLEFSPINVGCARKRETWLWRPIGALAVQLAGLPKHAHTLYTHHHDVLLLLFHHLPTAFFIILKITLAVLLKIITHIFYSSYKIYFIIDGQ